MGVSQSQSQQNQQQNAQFGTQPGFNPGSRRPFETASFRSQVGDVGQEGTSYRPSGLPYPSTSPAVGSPLMSATMGGSHPSSAARPMAIPSSMKNHQIIAESPAPSSPLSQRSSVAPSRLIRVTFTWNEPATRVAVTGSFLGWRTEMPLAPTNSAGDEWELAYNLEPGIHQYKFIVDGQWRHNPQFPSCHDNLGNVNNFMEVKDATKSVHQVFAEGRRSPPGEYSTEIPDRKIMEAQAQASKTKDKGPPQLPPHLLRALLNTAPNPDDPSVLALPHHVMVNHLYVKPREDHRDVVIVGATHMFRGKYVTSVFYAPPPESAVSESSAPINTNSGVSL